MKKQYKEPIVEIDNLSDKDIIITSETTVESFDNPFEQTEGNTRPWKW